MRGRGAGPGGRAPLAELLCKEDLDEEEGEWAAEEVWMEREEEARMSQRAAATRAVRAANVGASIVRLVRCV